MYTVLIIEDDVLLQEYYNEILILEGYQTLNVFQGTEAISKIEKYGPDVIILDLAVPGKSGREILLDIKKYHLEIPIIVISVKKDYLL